MCITSYNSCYFDCFREQRESCVIFSARHGSRTDMPLITCDN